MREKQTDKEIDSEAVAEEVDLEAIDAFLEKGLGALDEPDADPISGLKAPPRLSRPRESRTPPSPPGPPSKARPPVPEGAVRVSVTKDRMRARLTVQPARARHLRFEDVTDALRRASVCNGVNEDAIIELVEAAPGAQEAELSILVAEGTPPVAGREAEVVFPGVDSSEDLLGLRRAGRRLRELLASGKVQEVDETCAGLPLLRPGEAAVRVSPATPGTAGMDVFGKEAPVAAVEDRVPAPGEGLKASEEGQTYVARAYGYLLIEDEQVSIAPPAWIAPDEMSVYALDLAPPNGPLDPAALIGQMRQIGIAPLPEVEGLKGQLKGTDGRPRAVLVGSGVPPTPGQDARVEMKVEVGSRAGKVLEDGSIDFKQRNFAATVEKDTLLAVKLHATPGRTGLTVRGQEIPTKASKDAPLAAGQGVEAAQEDGRTLFYARAEGCVHHRNGVLEVRPALRVSGDVDYGTGNIDFKGDLTIVGTVREGFSVKATGDIVIGGGVENGAQVTAGRSVTVSKGVFGEKTRVVALGDIRAQFVQDAALMGRGDVEVGSYIYNASVRAGGGVTVHGLGERGGIVGGEVCAKTHLVASSAGSEYGTATRLLAGVDAELMRSLQKAQQGLELCRANMQKIMSALKVTSPDPQEIGRAFASLPSSQRQQMRLLARKLEELAQMEKRLDEERRGLSEQARSLRRAAQIRVSGTIFHNVDLFIGRTHRSIDDALKAVTFRLSEEGQLEAGPFKGAQPSAVSGPRGPENNGL